MASEQSMTAFDFYQLVCEHFAGLVSDIDGFRQMADTMEMPLLAEYFENFDHLVDLLAKADSPTADYALPTITMIRGMCAAAGIRRGVVLSCGKQPAPLAALIVAERIISASVGLLLGQN